MNVEPIHDSNGRSIGFSYKGRKFAHYTTLPHDETAFFNLSLRQKIFLSSLAGVFGLTLFLNWHQTLIVLFAVVTVIYFLDLVFNAFIIFESYRKLPEFRVDESELRALADADCPSYTIFCPLYHEWQVVPQFIEAMQQLDYPREKLQILFLLEENDTETVEKVRTTRLPEHFAVVIVPDGKPKTKPKAMNYGLDYATGKYIVVYDAEDVPDSDQLKKAVITFRHANPKVACVQAKLNFYNPTQNLLTKLFAAEYSLWFDLVLPGFQSIHAPIPLGGTSNHFRADILRHVGGWDAFNVTEDCDLGMRLAKRGFETAIVDSTTGEEANSQVRNWYNQRSRWIKGYIQTFFVHTRFPEAYMERGKLRNFFLFQLIVGGKVISLFINPLMWITTIGYFLFRPTLGPIIQTFFPWPVLYLGVFSLVFGNFLYLYYYMVGCAKRGFDGLIKYIFLVPLYWLGMSAAAWKALYEIVVKPHYWAKTVHGLHLTPGASPALAPAFAPALVRYAPPISLAATPVYHEPQPAESLVSPVSVPEPVPITLPDTSIEPEPLPEALELPPEPEPAEAEPESEPAPMPEPSVPMPEPIESPYVPAPALRPVAAAAMRLPSFTVLTTPAWLTNIKDLWHSTVRFSISSAGLLVLATIAGNFLGYVFNAYVGRAVNLEEFGTITILNTFVYLLNVFVGALGTTVTHMVSYLEGTESGEGSRFFRGLWIKILFSSVVAGLAWIVFIPVLADFLRMPENSLLLAFTPAIIFSAFNATNNGYLQGIFSFGMLALLSALEPIGKLYFAWLALSAGRPDLVPLSIPGAIAVSWVASSCAVMYINRIYPRSTRTSSAFPLGFYSAAIMRGASVAAFLSVDVILAKHFLSPVDAGLYSMLSLVGKMIFYFGTLLNMFVVTFVSRDLGKGEDTRTSFNFLLIGTTLLSACTGLSLIAFAPEIIPLLLGPKSVGTLPYVPGYAMAMTLFSISTTIVLYRLSRKEYFFPAFSLMVTGLLTEGLISAHSTIGSFVQVLLGVNIYYFLFVLLTHYFYGELRLMLRDLRDLLSVFMPLPKAPQPWAGRMRILIFNWRDSQSVFAGGAETYIHALAERWVADGHSVTLFTSNDGHQKQNGTIRGIRVLRRGGFYTVYLLAPIYYLCALRGKFDLIIDCENGIPFFTPLFAKEPVYCLVHHIHQEVFRKSLPLPLAVFAALLERRAMPLVYRRSNFITVSDSSRKDIERLKITNRPVYVVHPGVDLQFLSPGKKLETPLIAYIGRLKEYKSVNVLLAAFTQVLRTTPEAKLVIAGDGDEMARLQAYAKELGVDESVQFFGKVSEKKKRTLMRMAWVCVNPSMMEGWGITTIEANACGTPVVASDVPGLRDSVRDAETGFLVPHGNPDVLADALLQLIANAPMRAFMGERALVWASRFSWDESSRNFIGILSEKAYAPAAALQKSTQTI